MGGVGTYGTPQGGEPWWEGSPKWSCGQAAAWKRGRKGELGLRSLTCACLSSGSARRAASAAGQTDLVADIAAGRQERAQVSLAFFVALSADRLAALACEKGLWEDGISAS